MNCAIGLDLGGTSIKYALVNEEGVILYQSLKPTGAEGTREDVIDRLEACVREIINYIEDDELNILGVGVGTPGVIDNGLVLGGAENLPDWESLPLGGILSRRLNLPVRVDNDANLMGLAEVRFGKAIGTSDVIFLTIGTGVGGAMVLNGKLYGGHRNRGAELGHVIVNVNGEQCSCGAKGCLEAHASTSALVRNYKILAGEDQFPAHEKVNGKFIIERYLQEEPLAIQVMEQHFDYLAKGIAGFINVFSPQKVIIGGGISEAGDFYIEKVREKAMKLAMKETAVFTQIEAAALGNKAGFLGAAALVFDYCNETNLN